MINNIKKIALPPCIKRCGNKLDLHLYQTVYNKIRSIAAPTSGFYFSISLSETLYNQDIDLDYI